jgi:hypothetical protein
MSLFHLSLCAVLYLNRGRLSPYDFPIEAFTLLKPSISEGRIHQVNLIFGSIRDFGFVFFVTDRIVKGCLTQRDRHMHHHTAVIRTMPMPSACWTDHNITSPNASWLLTGFANPARTRLDFQDLAIFVSMPASSPGGQKCHLTDEQSILRVEMHPLLPNVASESVGSFDSGGCGWVGCRGRRVADDTAFG